MTKKVNTKEEKKLTAEEKKELKHAKKLDEDRELFKFYIKNSWACDHLAEDEGFQKDGNLFRIQNTLYRDELADLVEKFGYDKTTKFFQFIAMVKMEEKKEKENEVDA